MLMAAESIVTAYIAMAPHVVEDVDGGGEAVLELLELVLLLLHLIPHDAQLLVRLVEERVEVLQRRGVAVLEAQQQPSTFFAIPREHADGERRGTRGRSEGACNILVIIVILL